MKNFLTICLILCAAGVFGQSKPEPPATLKQLFTTPLPASATPAPAASAERQPTQVQTAPALPAWATKRHLADSVKPGSCEDICCCWGMRKDTRAIFMFDSRQSYFSGQWTRMTGLKLGMELYEKYRFGLGVYTMAAPIFITSLSEHEFGFERALSVNYSTLFFEYVAYRDYKWELSFPVQLGSGRVRVDTLSPDVRQWQAERRDTIGIATFGAAGHYKVFPWVGVGLGVGVRQAITPFQEARKALNGPFYSIRIKIFIGYLVKLAFAPKKVKAEKEAWLAERKARQQGRIDRRNNESPPVESPPPADE